MNIRRSAKFIYENANHVKINIEGVRDVVKLILSSIIDGTFSQCEWQNQQDGTVHPTDNNVNVVDWVFFMSTINFSFWTEKDQKFIVTYKGKQQTGYFSACACTNRALEKGIPLTEPKFYASITIDQMKDIFQDDEGKPMPMLNERMANLHEVGVIINQDFNGTFKTLIENSGNDAMSLLQIISETFPCYRDEAIFKGENVQFYKRGQICISDVHEAMKSQSSPGLTNIDKLTIFADYRVPQSLYFLGAMKYSEELLKFLRNDHLFKSGSDFEVEIRGLTIYTCEMIVQVLNSMLKEVGKDFSVPAANIDYFLWVFRRKNAEKIEQVIPMHKTRCIYY